MSVASRGAGLSTALRFLVPLLALSARTAAGEDPTPGKPADVAALRAGMENAYREIEKDFDALRGARAKDTVAALARSASGAAKERTWAQAAEAWVKEKILGPIVAGRMAKAAEKGGGPGAASLEPTIESAAASVFPEKTLVDNWEKHFLDLEVVTRWRAASGLPPAPAPGEAGSGKAPGSPGGEPSDMVLVPKGELIVTVHRGWPNPAEKPGKRHLRAFYIDRTEATCAAFGLYLRGVKDAKVRERFTPADWPRDKVTGMPVVPEGRANHPVTGVSYEGAAAFAASLGKRLPTEDEWERAERGDDMLLFPWGTEWVAGAANIANATSGTAPVGSFEKDRSPFGVLDMSGNVSEFVATLEDGKLPKGMPRDTDRLVRRGGNYKSPPEEGAGDYRYVIGTLQIPKQEGLGFRCAMDEDDYRRRYGGK